MTLSIDYSVDDVMDSGGSWYYIHVGIYTDLPAQPFLYCLSS